MDEYSNSTTVTTIQNGVDDVNYNRVADGEEVVISAFDNLHDIHNDDSDGEQNVTTIKTITYSHNTSDISGDPEHNNPELNVIMNADNQNVSNESELIMPGNNSDQVDNNYLKETVITTITNTIESPQELDDSVVDDFFSGAENDEDEFTEQNFEMGEAEVSRPYGGGLAVAAIPAPSQEREDGDGGYDVDESDTSGYEPPAPIHSNISDSDVLITSEVRNADDIIPGETGDVDNEFEIPDVKIDSDSQEEAVSNGGMEETVKEKVTEVRNKAVDYVGENLDKKLDDVSDDGLLGQVKNKIVESEAVEKVKDNVTEVSDSAINNDELIESVKDKLTSTDVITSSVLDNSKTVDDSDVIKPENVTNVETEPPVIEIDTVNALGDDDMDYEMQEVDISQSNDEDFGKVFADHRQSMREGTATPLFHQDASRFTTNNNGGTLKSENKQTKNEKKNGSSYAISSMPADEERPTKGCASILKSFFCPKRGSWQPDSYF